MAQSSTNPRLAAAREDAKTAYERRVRGAIIRLLKTPDFRFYMAHLIWGRLGLERFVETDGHKARHNAAVLIRDELSRLDPAGFVQLGVEHVKAQAEELEVELPTAEEEAAHG